MANITAGMVKDLRETTGAGMMDCKAALTETNGDMQAAVDWLRKKGLSKAAKKAGRVAAEGLIGIFVTGKKGAMVEVNSETDFVARNDHFQGLVKMIADVALNTGEDIEAIKAAKAGSMTIADAVSSAIATIGENITPRRAAVLSVGQGAIGSYVHNQVSDGLGKIGVLVALESPAMPVSLRCSAGRSRCTLRRQTRSRSMPSGVDPAIVKREKDILADKFRCESGIGAQIPAAANPVGVQDHERAFGPRIRELLDAARLLSDDSVVRHHVPAVLGAHDRPGDVSDPRETYHTRAPIEHDHGRRRAPGMTKAPVQTVHDLGRAVLGVRAEDRHRLQRCLGRRGSMTEAVHHENLAALVRVQDAQASPHTSSPGLGTHTAPVARPFRNSGRDPPQTLEHTAVPPAPE